jgi:hypothetical protein
VLITTLSLQQEKNMICLKNFKILKNKSRWFFHICIQENKKISKKATIKDWYWQSDASEKNLQN